MKAEIQASVLLTQTKVEQELAISRCIIDSAEEVEIEEYYDISGKGSIGLSGDAVKETIDLGFSAKGRKVTKRIIRFKGCSPIIHSSNSEGGLESDQEPNFVLK